MKLYNTLSRQVEEFIPSDSKSVKMYVCGITPYDTTHLGHAFTYLFFDSLNRYLRYKGFDVSYTQNVTDINDRDNDILKRALEQKTDWQDLAKFWTDKFLTDMGHLNWLKPENYLWASQQIPQIIVLIDQLIKKGYAYSVNGAVYLNIKKSNDFGKLSRLNPEEMMILAKQFEEDIDNPNKTNQLDITLWRPTKAGQAEHIPSFESLYGPGRPGWHIECSAMSISSLGGQIDIHGGGVDLIYPHHESEIAQSEGGTGKIPFSKFWIHSQIVSYEGQKMSKSLGNLVLVSDLLNNFTPNAIRYLMLSNHYRMPWEFYESELTSAEKNINIISKHLTGTHTEKVDSSENMRKFEAAMDNDMDTPSALKVFQESAENGKIEDAIKIGKILGFDL